MTGGGWTPGVISLLVPSRGRPERCRQMWESARQTATFWQQVELVLYLDQDDPDLGGYDHWLGSHEDEPRAVGIWWTVSPRILLTQTWNELLPLARGEILMHGNDDVLFRSQGWDVAVRDAFGRVPDRIVLVHGRDGIHDARLATLGFLHRAWVDTLGYLIAPHFSSDYGDTWNHELAERLGRRVFLPEVFTEHLHPAVGKGPLDRTHRERLARHGPDGNDQRWLDLAHLREQDAAKLQAAIDAYAGVAP